MKLGSIKTIFQIAILRMAIFQMKIFQIKIFQIKIFQMKILEHYTKLKIKLIFGQLDLDGETRTMTI